VNRRWVVAIPGCAALFCAAIVFYLIVQIDNTRKQLQRDGVIEFNFVQQADHNFDMFAHALSDYRTQRGTPEEDNAKQEYLLRYDVLYSLFFSAGTRFLGSLRSLDTARHLFEDGTEFISLHEPQMNLQTELDNATLLSIEMQARDLSQRIYDIGLVLFGLKSKSHDEIGRRMDRLYVALRAFGGTFILASVLALWLFFVMFKRNANIRASAQHTQSQLSTALDEITVSDIARQAQTRFVAAASHDLRQPLHALGLYLAALKSHVNTTQGQKILDSSCRSTEALNQLLNSMLDLSKLDAGVVDVKLAHVSLQQLFKRLQQTFEPKAAARQLQLSIDGGNTFALTDPVLFERIVSNLISNALDYTEKGRVSVTAHTNGERIDVFVKDTGMGIPLDEQHAVFDEYYQLNNPERDRTKGLGLGLSIVKRLTNLLEIGLKLESRPGKGSRFSLSVAKGSADKAHTDQTINPSAESTNLHGLSILVIDDENDVRDGMHTLLQQFRCDVVTVDSIESALTHIGTHQWVPELIVADYRLRNDQKGDSAIMSVREEVNEDVPAMIVTGDTSPARLREATASGFVLLHKPVIAKELVDAINQLMGEPA